MDPDLPLRVSHDVGQTLQRKLEGLADVERAFVHVDYEAEHDPHEEHKPLYDKKRKKRQSLQDVLKAGRKKFANMVRSTDREMREAEGGAGS